MITEQEIIEIIDWYDTSGVGINVKDRETFAVIPIKEFIKAILDKLEEKENKTSSQKLNDLILEAQSKSIDEYNNFLRNGNRYFSKH